MVLLVDVSGSMSPYADALLRLAHRFMRTGTTEVFTINVNNVNERPTGLSLSGLRARRSSPVGTVVGLLSAQDVDPGSTFNFSLVPGSGATDNSKFAIVGNELRINGSLGSGRRATIRVRVTDQGGLSYERVFSISISN